MSKKFAGILIRYTIATVGLMLVAVGVALSIISDLGTAPISCPPYVLSLLGGLTVGEYTALMHLSFIILQIILLRRKFKAEYLMQIVAALVFGALTDLTIWATGWIAAGTYAGKAGLMVLSVLITALGISIEVRCKAWMLAGEMTVSAISDVTGFKFRNVKIVFDISLVLIAAAIAWACFGSPLGHGENVVIREGTLVSALLTGFAMKFIEPLVDRYIGHVIDKTFRVME